jgi:homoserine O-acetyltransferase
MRKKNLLTVGVNSDILFPAWQVREVAEAASDAGAKVLYREIKSDVGHDAFLVETGQITEFLRDFFGSIGFAP